MNSTTVIMILKFLITLLSMMMKFSSFISNLKPNMDICMLTHLEIYIRVKDFAIVKLNYNYYIAKLEGKKKLYELNVEYREYQERMYLKYISYVNYFKIFTGDEIAQVHQYREFFINDIQNGKIIPIRKDEMINSNIPLHQQGVDYDPEFWDNYNIIMIDQPLKN